MPFSRYVEVGRVVIINYGKEYGKLYVISDIVDQNRVSLLRQVRHSTWKRYWDSSFGWPAAISTFRPSPARCSLQVLIDRPDETRRVENFKRLQLTDYKIDISKLAKKKALKAALEKDGECQQIACQSDRQVQ